MPNLNDMAKQAINLGTHKEETLAWSDVFPSDGTPFCPFQPAHTVTNRKENKTVVIRLYHPCLKQCRLYDEGRAGDGENPCSAAR